MVLYFNNSLLDAFFCYIMLHSFVNSINLSLPCHIFLDMKLTMNGFVCISIIHFCPLAFGFDLVTSSHTVLFLPSLFPSTSVYDWPGFNSIHIISLFLWVPLDLIPHFNIRSLHIFFLSSLSSLPCGRYEAWAERLTRKVRIVSDGSRSNEERSGAVACMMIGCEGKQDDTLFVAG